MARVVITFEDLPNGNVKIVAAPNFEMMASKANAGYELTAAEGYAFHAINAVRREAKRQEAMLPVLIPRIGR